LWLIWDNDKNGIGVGLYGHLGQNCFKFFKDWGFDFIKVDWCGGEKMNLDEKTEYLKIIRTVKAINPEIVFNICCWKFPGEWAIHEADSWRISGDIRNTFQSILTSSTLIPIFIAMHQQAITTTWICCRSDAG
jgi:hypothetical protein